MTRVPIAEDLFDGPPAAPALIGGRCARCGAFVFPLRPGCPRCGEPAVERHRLRRTGTLWSWTSQGFPPKPPFAGTRLVTEPFQPWLIGVVDLSGQLRVEGILVGCTEDSVRIGMPVHVVTIPFTTDTAGNEVITYAFAPAPAGQEITAKEEPDA